jgi:hypothetical protein
MTKQGFIMLHRTIQKHWIYEEKRKFSKYEAWLDMLMMVNYKDNKILQDGKLVEVKRGERITSIRQLMERWEWSNTKVVNFLNLLSQDEMISYEITPKKKTLIKILKYHEYQGFQDIGQSEETTQNNHRPITETTQNNINNKDNKVNNVNKETLSIQQAEQFDYWWNLYNNKKGKVKCETKFKQLLKKYEYSIIDEGTKKYLSHRQMLSEKGEFVPNQKNPLTFLNGEHFNDEYDIQPSKQTPYKTNRGQVDFDSLRKELEDEQNAGIAYHPNNNDILPRKI